MPFEAHLSRVRVALLLAGSLFFALFALWVVGVFGGGPPSPPIHVKAAAWAGIVFCGVAGFVFARRLFESGVIVRVDDAGIYWQRWSEQVIPWSAITRISERKVKRSRFACLFLHDRAAYPSRGILGYLKSLSTPTGYGDISVTMTETDRSFDDLMAAIERFAPAELRGADSADGG
ncbi:STM3941 family protein [Mycobacterium sp. pUA109]|uniref:STM3941 family protein n=1 Tax=Mycobacterium sp. pUA109 TaxID=3238982 RepID=UPI00351B2BF4